MKNSDLWKSEIEYSHTKIKDDPRNNSAWSQRWFATHRGQVASFAGLGTFISYDELRKKGVILSSELADEEAHYALCGAEIDPYNESPWRYLIGVLMEQWRCAQRENNSHEISKAVELITNNISKIKELKHSLKDNPPLKEGAAPCVSLMSALVDLLELFVENEELLKEASNLCKELAEVDTVRRKYWRKRDANVMNII
jgi:protein farnesyltransferase/geranylgeranyltransferase type-1 subunit alpha